MKKQIITAIIKGDKPRQQTVGSAGLDLTCHTKEPILLKPGERALIPTGLYLEMPRGICGMVCSRSGLALANGVIVLNAPGIIDSDYRGEVQVILMNLRNDMAYEVKPRQRIAQLIFVPYITPVFIDVTNLEETERGVGGFGSTDK